MRRHSFSLIELLVTIAVIAILIGILVPALNLAKQKAIDLHCINNLKQFGTAFMTYRADSEDKMPMWSSDLFPTYIPSGQVYTCKRDLNTKDVTYPSADWRLNVPGNTADSRKFEEVYDFPCQAKTERNIADDDPKTKLKISYFYEFAYTKASWELAEDAGENATWWDLKYYQLKNMAPAGMADKVESSQKQLFSDNTMLFRDRQSTFPVLRCFWHMKGLSPEKDNTPVYNLSYDGNIFYSGPPAWEVNSWTQK